MNFIEILISNKLKDKNPMLDVLGSDRKVLQVACQDLTNCLKVHWDLIGKDASDCDIVERLEKLFNESPNELDEYLSVWTGIWLNKWNERVKLLIGNDGNKKWNRTAKTLSTGEEEWGKISNRREIEDLIVSSLVRNAEICGTSILAENLIKMELGNDEKEYETDQERIVNVVNDTLRKAKELAQSKGPLIFVKVDKGYYSGS